MHSALYQCVKVNTVVGLNEHIYYHSSATCLYSDSSWYRLIHWCKQSRISFCTERGREKCAAHTNDPSLLHNVPPSGRMQTCALRSSLTGDVFPVVLRLAHHQLSAELSAPTCDGERDCGYGFKVYKDRVQNSSAGYVLSMLRRGKEGICVHGNKGERNGD